MQTGKCLEILFRSKLLMENYVILLMNVHGNTFPRCEGIHVVAVDVECFFLLLF